MKVRDLLARINREVELRPGREGKILDAEVTIIVSRPGAVGPTPCVFVRAAGMGIDWDHGRFQLWPEKVLKELTQ